ncbi:hypothetical protein WA026_009735 [Henosepilachna vigintioctopunctata]|uniref:Attacin C-terminal domain-containing protein n=1 Tax=Henosepilachna vigintioctopunctata TaxID=420089 RepID=A0AAW1TR12_9CUCU
MKSVIALVALFFVCAHAYEIAENEFGEQYVMVPLPLVRHRRQSSVDISHGAGGTTITAGHQGNIFKNDRHQVTGGGFVSKQLFHPTGPTTLGGNLGYQHIPSGSGINLGASNTRGFGTDVTATGNANIWRRGNSRLDATGSYGRHFGGPWGTGRPNWGVGLNFSHRF